MLLSIIVPFHRNLRHLEPCLAALQPVPDWAEIIIVADGAVDDCRPLARRFGARVLEIAGPSGPAVARNRGADVAMGDVLVFIDADVVLAEGALRRLRDVLAINSGVDAVFGAYDETPAEPNFVSQYKNLAHSYIHQTSDVIAQTFWAGFGAVRATAFAAVGGFDERFRRPCVEDIDLGYRLTASGHMVLLRHDLRACHLKKWTMRSMVVSDIRDRGVPWTQLILRFGRFNNDLNLRSSYRACVVLSYVLAGLLATAPLMPMLLMPALLTASGLIFLGRRFYGYFVERRGVWFAARVFPLHCLYHLYNGLSFALGSTLYFSRLWLDLELPGALSVAAWGRQAPAYSSGVTSPSPAVASGPARASLMAASRAGARKEYASRVVGA